MTKKEINEQIKKINETGEGDLLSFEKFKELQNSDEFKDYLKTKNKKEI